jgi:hypothetical protein
VALALLRSHDDPAYFNDFFLGGPRFDPDPMTRQYQHEICQSVVDYHTTVVYSGNCLGKDFVFARLILWWLYTRRNSLVVVTAPTQNQVGSICWKEVRKAARGLRYLPQAKISNAVQSSPQQVNLGTAWQALGFATKSVERASGQHAGALLVLVIEGSGIEDEIWEAIDSLGAQRLAVNGNPIRAEGRFVELIRQADKDARDGVPKRKAVNAIRVASTESPHAALEHSRVGLADATWLETNIRRYGKDSLWVRSHIKAEIPSVSSQSLFELRWLDLATVIPRDPETLHPAHPAYATRRISGDLAEGVGRDSTSIWVTDDWGVLDVVNGDASDLADTAYKYYELGRQWGVPASRMSYDCLGAVGREFPLHLSRWNLGDAVGYAGSGASPDPAFTNLRTYAGMSARQRLNPEGADDYRKPHAGRTPFTIPLGDYWPRLREELGKLTYHLVKNQTALLSKEDHAKTLGHSPDYADGFLQRFGFT